MATFLLNTDQQHSVLGRSPFDPQAYSPYGFMQAGLEPVLGFCGLPRSSLTGQYLCGNGHRSYSPVLMRFLSADRCSPFDEGGLNTYAYCSGDPINRIDLDGQSWRTFFGAGSSAVTATGAIVRTARNEALRLQHRHRTSRGLPSTYAEPPLSSRIGNTAFAATGAAGVVANVLSSAESGWAEGSLIPLSTKFGLANTGGNIAGGVTSNFNAARETWALMGQPGIPSSSVVFGTFVEVTGLRMAGEAVRFVGRKSWELADRIAHTAQGAYQAWRQWGRGTTRPETEMRDVRRSDASWHV